MRLQTNRFRSSGLTLMELVMVVAILAFLAGLVTYNLTPNQLTFSGAGGNKTAGRIATEASLSRLKSAMLGTADFPGYWQDMNRDMWFWPRYLEWLSRPPADAADISGASPDAAAYFTSMMSFNASRRVGWRGPYLQFQGDIIPLDATRGFTSRLGGGVYRSPLDAWGKPIVMQWPSSYLGSGTADFGNARGDAAMAVFIASNSRLVSAGPDGILQTEININSLQTYEDFQLNPALVGDDVVVWLQH
jgi:type II secretory pathway pseudopilin PulG